jgi:hypothetical protein
MSVLEDEPSIGVQMIDFEEVLVHDSCMATKTITLELDAYEKLRSSKQPGESFSAVVRRATFEQSPVTGASLREYFRSDGSGVSAGYLDAVDDAAKQDSPPEDPWA